MNITTFFRLIIGVIVAMLIALVAASTMLVSSNRQFAHDHNACIQSYALGDELRQSSDDLTRFARTYVSTGDPKYEKIYWDILAIRNGVKSRPEHYQRIYWDFVAAGDVGYLPGKNLEAISLLQLMQQLGFSEDEFLKLNEAHEQSDELVKTEEIAFKAMKGLFDDGTGEFLRRGPPDQGLAIRLMHDKAYHDAKARIMRPIDEFLGLLEARPNLRVAQSGRLNEFYLTAILCITATLLLVTVISGYMVFKRVCVPIEAVQEQTRQLGCDISRLAQTATSIAKGDLSTSFKVQTRRLGSEASDLIGLLIRTHDGMIDHLQEAGSAIELITTDLTNQTVLLEKTIELVQKEVDGHRQTAEILEASEQQYLRLFETSPDAIMTICPPDWKFVSANVAAHKLFGSEVDQKLNSLGPSDLSPKRQPEGALSADEAKLNFETAMELGSHFFEWTHQTLDGRIFPASVLLSRVEVGGMYGLQAIVRDITQKKRAEAIAIGQTCVSRLGADIGIALTHNDTQRASLQKCTEAVVRHLDAAFARIWILNEEQQVLELRASAGLYTHIDGGHARVPMGKLKIGLIAQERKPHLTNAVIGDPRVSEQEWAKREGLVAFAGYPLIVGERLIGVLGMFSCQPLSDFTLNALSTISDSIAIGFARKQAEEKICQLNEGLEQRVKIRTEQLETANTELQLAIAKADQASLAKSQFLATMSHELRTPLNGVIGMSELLTATSLDAKQRLFVDACRSSGASLLNLIDDILDFSKIEAGRMELDLQDFDLEELVADTAETMSWRAMEKGLEMPYCVDPMARMILRGDSGRLRQLMTNLLGNAIKFTEYGEIAVRTQMISRQDNRTIVRFEVRDTGIGIPEDRKSRLFQSFSQADSSTTRKYGGTGLGLAISQSLVGLMGGVIGFQSEEGVGSTFWFEVPLEIVDKGSNPLPGVEQIRGRSVLVVDHQVLRGTELTVAAPDVGHRMEPKLFEAHILLAEDNNINRMFVVEMMKLLGCTCDIATNGREATEAVQRKSYDLVLMDCQMPEMDGFEATRRIREMEADGTLNGHLPIVALTANAIKGDRERCLDAGMDEYLTKPVHQAQIKSALAQFLTNYEYS